MPARERASGDAPEAVESPLIRPQPIQGIGRLKVARREQGEHEGAHRDGVADAYHHPIRRAYDHTHPINEDAGGTAVALDRVKRDIGLHFIRLKITAPGSAGEIRHGERLGDQGLPGLICHRPIAYAAPAGDGAQPCQQRR
jgi:hypothetical protein